MFLLASMLFGSVVGATPAVAPNHETVAAASALRDPFYANPARAGTGDDVAWQRPEPSHRELRDPFLRAPARAVASAPARRSSTLRDPFGGSQPASPPTTELRGVFEGGAAPSRGTAPGRPATVRPAGTIRDPFSG
jgi:hypothetical protein